MQSFRKKGLWWLPGDPQKQIPGILTFSPEKGLDLDLFEVVSGSQFRIINGILEAGGFVTLIDSFITGHSLNIPGFQSCRLFSSYCLLGPAPINNERDLKFHNAQIRFEYVDEWANLSKGFSFSTNTKNKEIQVTYKLPKPIEFPIEKGFKISLDAHCETPNISLVQKKANISQKIFVFFANTRKKRFLSLLEQVFHFQCFLVLCMFRRSLTFEYFLLNRNKKGMIPQKWEVLFKVDLPNEMNESLIPMDFLAPFHSISGEFSTLLCKWFREKKKLEPATTPYFNLFFNKTDFHSDRFLEITRCSEAFHRETVGLKDPTTRKEYYYQKRVFEILNSTKLSFNFLLKIKSFKIFSRKVKDLRNDFTHSNPLKISLEKKFRDAYFLTNKLVLIMSCAFLKYLGLPLKKIKLLLDNCREFNHYKRP